jgi:hypothetical protein
MTKTAESHAIGDVVVVALAPRDYMGGIDHCVTVRSDHANAAQGAAAGIGSNDGPSETLIAHRRLIVLLLVLPGLAVGFLEQPQTVVESLGVHCPLLDQGRPDFLSKIGRDQHCSQDLALFFTLQ